MSIHKGDSEGDSARLARAALRRPAYVLSIAAPLACLVAYAVRLPLPLPRFLTPTRTYTSADSTTTAILRDAAGRFGTVTIRSDGAPALADIEAARRYYADTGMPVAFRDDGSQVAERPGAPGPLAAYSMSIPGDGSPAALTLLVDESTTAPLSVSVDGIPVSGMAEVPADRRIRVPVSGRSGAGDDRADGTAEITVESGPPGSVRSSTIAVAAPSADRPRILMASRRPGARSVVEALRLVRKVPYGELLSAGLYDYELVVLDGMSLPELEGAAAAALAEYIERGSGSLLCIIDSPETGKPGDAPALERVLPVELSPRSLSRLPDIAMVVAMDVSGSMYGDKLSLAKAVGLELVANLKPGDEAGVLLFDDEARWLYPPAPVAEFDAARSLAPLRAGGGTRLHPALAECIAALESSGRPEKRIVIVSDGITAPADFDALAARAFKAGIGISAMAVGAEYDKELLTRIAAGSGGKFYRVRDVSEVPSLIIQDRKSISRTVFAEERVAVVDIAGAEAGFVTGMARLGPKPDAVAFFSSAAGDPLFISRRIGARSSLAYASDAYGRYGAEFLEKPGTLSVLEAVLGGLFSERPPAAELTETSDGLALSIRADYLVEPYAALADGRGRIVAEAPFSRVAPGRFHAELGKPAPGRYTALVEDRGRTVARFAVVSNGGTAAAPSDSARAALAYRTPFWVLPRAGAPWLLAFFALSLAATVATRLRR